MQFTETMQYTDLDQIMNLLWAVETGPRKPIKRDSHACFLKFNKAYSYVVLQSRMRVAIFHKEIVHHPYVVLHSRMCVAIFHIEIVHLK